LGGAATRRAPGVSASGEPAGRDVPVATLGRGPRGPRPGRPGRRPRSPGGQPWHPAHGAARPAHGSPVSGTSRSLSRCPRAEPCCWPLAGRTRVDDATDLLEDAAISLRLASRSRAGPPRPSRMRWRCGSRASCSGRFLLMLSRAAHATPAHPRSPGTRPACCSRTSPGTRTRKAAFPSRIAAESARLGPLVTTFSTSPRSFGSSCRITATGANPLSWRRRSPCCPPTPPPRSRLGCRRHRRNVLLPSGPTTTALAVFVNHPRNALVHNRRGKWWSPPPSVPGPGRAGTVDSCGSPSTARVLPASWPAAVPQAACQRDPLLARRPGSGTPSGRGRAARGPGFGLSHRQRDRGRHGGRLELELRTRTCFLLFTPARRKSPAIIPASVRSPA